MSGFGLEDSLLEGLSIVIPVYNSEESLRELVDALITDLNGSDLPYEIILVDDASRDASWSIIGDLAAGSERVQGVAMSRNFGQHPALLAGLRHARFALTVTMDDDLQHLPSEIDVLRAGLTPEVDLVYGQAIDEEHGFWRSLSSRAVKASLGAAVGAETAAKASAFRLFRTSLRGAFATSADPYISIDVLLSWATTRIVTVPVRMDPRRYGASQYTLRKLGQYAINMLTGFSVLPLRFVTSIGFGFAFFGLLVLAYILIRYVVEGGSIPGFPFLASLIAVFSGAQLLALGILGEYLGRVHFRSMQRPPYVVRAVVGTPR